MTQQKKLNKVELMLPEDIGDVCFVFGSDGMHIMQDFWDKLAPPDQFQLVMVIEDSMAKLKAEMVKVILKSLGEGFEEDDDEDEEEVVSASKH